MATVLGEIIGGVQLLVSLLAAWALLMLVVGAPDGLRIFLSWMSERRELKQSAREKARLQAKGKRAEEKQLARRQAALSEASLGDRVDYDGDTSFCDGDNPAELDILFACRRCGTCYEEHHVYGEKPEWCPFCITEQPDVVFDGLRPSDLADSVGTFMNNFSKEARKAKRWRMARRRGFRTVTLHGPPLSAAEAYGNRSGTAWADGLPMYEDLVRDGH